MYLDERIPNLVLDLSHNHVNKIYEHIIYLAGNGNLYGKTQFFRDKSLKSDCSHILIVFRLS